MEEMSNNRSLTSGQFAAIFIGGAVAGAVTALMLSPGTGRENRKRVSTAFRRGKQQIVQLPPAISNAYSEAAKAAQDAFHEAYSRQTSELLEDVEEGAG